MAPPGRLAPRGRGDPSGRFHRVRSASERFAPPVRGPGPGPLVHAVDAVAARASRGEERPLAAPCRQRGPLARDALPHRPPVRTVLGRRARPALSARARSSGPGVRTGPALPGRGPARGGTAGYRAPRPLPARHARRESLPGTIASGRRRLLGRRRRTVVRGRGAVGGRSDRPPTVPRGAQSGAAPPPNFHRGGLAPDSHRRSLAPRGRTPELRIVSAGARRLPHLVVVRALWSSDLPPVPRALHPVR